MLKLFLLFALALICSVTALKAPNIKKCYYALIMVFSCVKKSAIIKQIVIIKQSFGKNRKCALQFKHRVDDFDAFYFNLFFFYLS